MQRFGVNVCTNHARFFAMVNWLTPMDVTPALKSLPRRALLSDGGPPTVQHQET
jgi:hypothetical protein